MLSLMVMPLKRSANSSLEKIEFDPYRVIPAHVRVGVSSGYAQWMFVIQSRKLATLVWLHSFYMYISLLAHFNATAQRKPYLLVRVES